MSRVSLSHCGQYVAVADNTDISIHRAVPQFQLKRIEVTKVVHKHLGHHSASEEKVNLHGMYWESVVAPSKSTKFALSISMDDFNAVIIYDITSSAEDPVIIELESAIEHVDWILGAPKEGSAYKNCTQLVLFDRLGLEARVYSLDCTKILFTLPKPTYKTVLRRPKLDNFWSLLSTPYYDKNLTARSITVDLQSASYPYLLHFTNDGSRSSLLASLELDFHPSPSAQITWDPSGTWICFFDANDSLFGYTLRVYNSLAIYETKVDSLAHHRALPVLYLRHNDGSGWVCQWSKMEELLFIALIPQTTSQKIEMRLHGLSHLSIAYSVEVDLGSSENIWIYESSDAEASYRRTEVCPETNFTWRRFEDSGKLIALCSDNVVAILRRSCVGAVVRIEPEAYISSLRCQGIQFVGDSIAILCEQCLVMYETGSVRILATSQYIFKSMKVSELLGVPFFTLVEHTPQGETWRQVTQSGEDESSMLILKSFPYKEESSKVVNLVKEVQRSEWTQASRRRLTEDNDTFKFNMKRRRSTRPDELH